ncbi:MAG: hypothetical protein AAGN35_26475 [Bacteroidota bacterium]
MPNPAEQPRTLREAPIRNQTIGNSPRKNPRGKHGVPHGYDPPAAATFWVTCASLFARSERAHWKFQHCALQTRKSEINQLKIPTLQFFNLLR